MNIFRLDNDIKTCAMYHCDRHIVKMPLELCQLLCTAHHVLNPSNVPEYFYKPTHKNHPCAIWVRDSVDNYHWTYLLLKELLKEYTYRYGKIHKCSELLGALMFFPTDMNTKSTMEMPLCMPDYCKIGNPVESYREYYRKEKGHMFSWKNREIPHWVTI